MQCLRLSERFFIVVLLTPLLTYICIIDDDAGENYSDMEDDENSFAQVSIVEISQVHCTQYYIQ